MTSLLNALLVLDRLGADEEPAPDVLIRVPVARHGGDLVLLPRKLVIGLDYAPARTLAGREKLAARPLGEHPRTYAGKQLMRSSQVFARVEPPPLTAEPFAVQQSGACQLQDNTRPFEVPDRLTVQIVGDSPLGEQRPRASLKAERQLCSARLGT